MQNNEITLFAETTFRNQNQRFGIKTDDRRRHMYLIGKTGMGKSTILENMIVNDIRAGRGVAVVDPHGDLAEKVVQYIPNNRINDVIYFNPADFNYPIAFNVVEHVDPQFRHLVASGLVGVFQKLWADSWGPRLEYILRNTILAVLDYPGSTLLAVIRMLSDKKFRKQVIEKIQDPVVKAFWVNEFAGYADKFASEAVSPIQNKVGQFLSTSLIRNIVGQVKSTIDMRKIMDEGKILILNLSKGRIGEDSSALLGAMMITKIQLAAMSRVDTPEDDRRDFYLYVDEFQNFVSESFANILSEARKYRLNLIMAHQYIEQLGDTVKPAVFGNVGTMIVHRVGAADAEELVTEFAPTFTEEDIVNLPKYEIYLKLMIDGIASEPFSARGLPPLREDEKEGNFEKVINVSRERYARERVAVEEKIARWHSSDAGGDDSGGKKKLSGDKQGYAGNRTDNIASSESIYIHEAICARCNKPTKTSFKPDGIRPVYCKDCLSVAREEKNREMENRKAAKAEELRRLREEDTKPANGQKYIPPQRINTASSQSAPADYIRPRPTAPAAPSTSEPAPVFISESAPKTVFAPAQKPTPRHSPPQEAPVKAQDKSMSGTAPIISPRNIPNRIQSVPASSRNADTRDMPVSADIAKQPQPASSFNKAAVEPQEKTISLNEAMKIEPVTFSKVNRHNTETRKQNTVHNFNKIDNSIKAKPVSAPRDNPPEKDDKGNFPKRNNSGNNYTRPIPPPIFQNNNNTSVNKENNNNSDDQGEFVLKEDSPTEV